MSPENMTTVEMPIMTTYDINMPNFFFREIVVLEVKKRVIMK